MKLLEWMKKNRYRVCEIEKMSGVDHSAIAMHNHHARPFGKKRAMRISAATGGEVSVIELMFPELEVKILKKRDKNKCNEKNECAEQCNDAIAHQRAC